MKSIIFAGIICCLIAAVDAPTLLTDAPSMVKDHKRVCANEISVHSKSLMMDIDARFLASE